METLRKIKRWFDGRFTRCFGRRVLLENVVIKPKEEDTLYIEDKRDIEWEFPVELYGFYEHPDTGCINYFGIDAPDEMALELNYADTVKKLGKVPDVGSRITTFDMYKWTQWIVLQRNVEDHRIWGSGRLILALQRYCKPVMSEHHSSVSSTI